MIKQDYINRNVIEPDFGAESFIKQKNDKAVGEAIEK